MGWTKHASYSINDREELSLWNTGISYNVRLNNYQNNTAYFLLESKDLSEAERFYELIKAAYEELIY